jgi:N-acetylglucosaminyldiphosphoundecaprenol N-acetyl-beta-D-mannosaminyltransferase
MEKTTDPAPIKYMIILGTRVFRTTYELVTLDVCNWALAGKNRYICIANVHMLMEANDSSKYQKVINRADLVLPDGMPLVWIMRLKGVKNQARVYGPTLMLHVLEMAEKELIPVGFYGSDEKTLEKLVSRLHERFPALLVVYTYSPPFRNLNKLEDAEITEEVIGSGARILFVGLGCPKQEIWMAEHKGKFPAVMLGVGAAFDFHAGIKPQAPIWMQTTGLEWLFRLLHEPRRLARRYLYNNPRFVLLAIMDLLGILNLDK